MACVLAVAGCGSDDGESTDTTREVSTTSADATTTSTVETTEPEDSTTTSTTTADDTTTTGLPGEAIDFGPRAGDALAVIGVAFDDMLNVRAAPGTDGEVVATLDPLADDLTALGNTRDLSPGFWIELEEGWVSLSFVGYLGLVTDETSMVVGELDGIPTAGTMVELGQIVAETFGSDDVESDIVQVTEATVGDLGEVTFDVIGLADDAQVGWRVHVFGAREGSDEPFGLRSAEVTALCGRGVTEDLRCR